MTVSLDAGAITLSGTCGVEDVDVLIGYLESSPDLCVDVRASSAIHTALWQALMVSGARIVGSPAPASSMAAILAGVNAYIESTKERL